MPALFIGHGSPLNALTNNRYSQAWRRIGRALPRPKAILVISAHWYVPRVAVTAMDEPKTIHDFGGFPQALFDFQYPAPGSPALAARVRDVLQPLKVNFDQSWGLDHGAWSVLAHLFPQADVPVVQLSIDRSRPHRFHYDLGKQLAPLRDEEVLILGSGNVVHNLSAINWRASAAAYDWAARFEQAVKDRLRRRDHGPLVEYERLDPEALRSVPTPEHYLPLLYIAGLQQDDETALFPVEGIDMGAVSMLAFAITPSGLEM